MLELEPKITAIITQEEKQRINLILINLKNTFAEEKNFSANMKARLKEVFREVSSQKGGFAFFEKGWNIFAEFLYNLVKVMVDRYFETPYSHDRKVLSKELDYIRLKKLDIFAGKQCDILSKELKTYLTNNGFLETGKGYFKDCQFTGNVEKIEPNLNKIIAEMDKIALKYKEIARIYKKFNEKYEKRLLKLWQSI